MLDTVHSFETPEGVRLALRSAGPVPRGLAFLVDASIRAILYSITAFVLALIATDLVQTVLVLVVFAGEWFYPVFFEVLNHGQTFGKTLLGLRVVQQDGTPVGWSASIVRNLLLAADLLPGTYAVGLVSMTTSRSFQRLGDLAAGTLVIHVAQPRDEPAPGAPTVRPIAPPIPLTLDEQRALIAFTERAPLLSDARADELAGLATPLHADSGSPRERLLGIGAWLLGRAHEEGA